MSETLGYIGILTPVVIPVLGLLAVLPWRNRDERAISAAVMAAAGLNLLWSAAFAAYWLLQGPAPLHHAVADLFRKPGFTFAIHLHYDAAAAAFAVCGGLLFFVVISFSRHYMHRDTGFKRFFATVMLFATGYNLVVLSGNFETLFIGWEVVGLSSFLLIAFYRDRYLPVRNAFKTLSYYRIGDVSLMLAMWMLHHLTHRNIGFDELAAAGASAGMNGGAALAGCTALAIALAAIVKSAGFPFTGWLPRAMEGPTTSSAIFYGSLSVHIGVFLLLRTYPFWEGMTWLKALLAVAGVATAATASVTAAVQPTVKTQIAYSSAAQIGIIVAEVALGLHTLALLHFMGNAFLRTYQLLVSPSMLNYLIHHQYFHHEPGGEAAPGRWKASLYMAGLRECWLDGFFHKRLWQPFKRLGGIAAPLLATPSLVALLALAALALRMPPLAGGGALMTAAFLTAFLAILAAFSHRGEARTAWNALPVAHTLLLAGVHANGQPMEAGELALYGSGILASWAAGACVLARLHRKGLGQRMDGYQGHAVREPGAAFVFLLSALGMAGFPVTGAFIGVDLALTYVHKGQPAAVAVGAGCLLFIELAAVRVYLRLFLGLQPTLTRPTGLRST